MVPHTPKISQVLLTYAGETGIHYRPQAVALTVRLCAQTPNFVGVRADCACQPGSIQVQGDLHRTFSRPIWHAVNV